MAINYKEDYVYANERLSGSLVRLEDCPVMIGEVHLRTGMTTYSRSRFGERTSERTHLRDFDLTPIRLGYMNLEPGASYIMRMPARVYKQGLRDNVLSNRRLDLTCSAFVNCVQDRYPDLDNAMDTIVNEERLYVAFNKRFGIKRQRNSYALMYKDKGVGDINPKTKDVAFSEEYEFLKETYERAIA